MQTTEQTLSTAIAELNCVSRGTRAKPEDLVALSAARDCIDELLRSCVDELRADPDVTYSWSAIAYALGSSSVATTQRRYGAESAPADDHVRAFWQAFAESFAWNFLPTDFLHELYLQWMTDEFPDATPHLKKAFTRRLRAAAIPPDAPSEWFYIRSRPGSLMNAAEPLVSRVPHWTPIGFEKAQYGLRRSKTAQ